MRYFIIVISGTAKNGNPYHFSLANNNEKYPSLVYLKTLVNNELMYYGTALNSICVENIIELSMDDFKSYKEGTE